jgi:hypothetical protein
MSLTQMYIQLALRAELRAPLSPRSACNYVSFYADVRRKLKQSVSQSALRASLDVQIRIECFGAPRAHHQHARKRRRRRHRASWRLAIGGARGVLASLALCSESPLRYRPLRLTE